MLDTDTLHPSLPRTVGTHGRRARPAASTRTSPAISHRRCGASFRPRREIISPASQDTSEKSERGRESLAERPELRSGRHSGGGGSGTGFGSSGYTFRTRSTIPRRYPRLLQEFAHPLGVRRLGLGGRFGRRRRVVGQHGLGLVGWGWAVSSAGLRWSERSVGGRPEFGPQRRPRDAEQLARLHLVAARAPQHLAQHHPVHLGQHPAVDVRGPPGARSGPAPPRRGRPRPRGAWPRPRPARTPAGSPAVSTSPTAWMTAYRTTFCNSRTFPGQACALEQPPAPPGRPSATCLPSFRFASRTKCSTSSGMSSSRSRSGGSVDGEPVQPVEQVLAEPRRRPPARPGPGSSPRSPARPAAIVSPPADPLELLLLEHPQHLRLRRRASCRRSRRGTACRRRPARTCRSAAGRPR